MPEAVIQHVPGKREGTLNALLSVFPNAVVVECQGYPMTTFRRALEAIDCGGFFFEDDARLTNGFLEKTEKLRSEWFVQFFSRKKMPPGIYSMPPSSWIYNVGFWLPSGHGKRISTYAANWHRLKEHPTGFDLVIRDYLISKKLGYFIHVPSLVQHVVGPSLLGPRAKDRSSPTFMP